MWVWSLGQEDPLEEGMATHYNILAWRIPWTEESEGLQSTGSQRVRHNWVTQHRWRLTFHPASPSFSPLIHNSFEDQHKYIVSMLCYVKEESADQIEGRLIHGKWYPGDSFFSRPKFGILIPRYDSSKCHDPQVLYFAQKVTSIDDCSYQQLNKNQNFGAARLIRDG